MGIKRLINCDWKIWNMFKPVTHFLAENVSDINIPEYKGQPVNDLAEIFPTVRKQLGKLNPVVLCKFEQMINENKIESDIMSRYVRGYDKIGIDDELNPVDAVLSLGHELGHAVSHAALLDDENYRGYAEIPSNTTERKIRNNMEIDKNNIYDKLTCMRLKRFAGLQRDGKDAFDIFNIDGGRTLSYYFGALYSVLLPGQELDKLYDKTPEQLHGIGKQIMEKPNAAIARVEEYLW